MEWKLCRKKEYEVRLCLAERNRVYNVPDAGKVYNHLEDVVETVREGDCVCQGTVGEYYLIPRAKLGAYAVDPDAVGTEWTTVRTRPDAGVYFCRPALGKEALHTSVGVMHANRDGVGHGAGDMVVCAAESTEDGYRPLVEDCWVVNGVVFADTYEILA